MAIQTQNNARQCQEALERGVRKALLEGGILIQHAIETRGDHPVLTGDMRKNWDVEPKNPTRKIEVGNYQSYAEYVEFGTSRQKAQHPGRKGFNDVKNKLQDTMQNAINRELK